MRFQDVAAGAHRRVVPQDLARAAISGFGGRGARVAEVRSAQKRTGQAPFGRSWWIGHVAFLHLPHQGKERERESFVPDDCCLVARRLLPDLASFEPLMFSIFSIHSSDQVTPHTEPLRRFQRPGDRAGAGGYRSGHRSAHLCTGSARAARGAPAPG